MRPSRLIALALLTSALAGAPALAQPAAKPQTSAAQGVTVKVTPRHVSGDGKPWIFDIVFDTHTQELKDDVAGSAVLVADDGRRSVPTGWQGDGPGGHHRKGSLSFGPITPPPRSLELQLQRPGEPAPRSFRWQLQ